MNKIDILVHSAASLTDLHFPLPLLSKCCLSVLKIGFNGIFTWRMSFVGAKKTGYYRLNQANKAILSYNRKRDTSFLTKVSGGW